MQERSAFQLCNAGTYLAVLVSEELSDQWVSPMVSYETMVAPARFTVAGYIQRGFSRFGNGHTSLCRSGDGRARSETSKLVV